MEERFAMANGVRLHYLEWGRADDPAVVLLHGASGFCRDWDLIGGELQDRFHCIAPDIRGFGDSDWPGVASTEEEADDVAALMRTLGLATAHVVGHSRMGRVATSLAARYSEAVRSLTIVDASPDPPVSVPERSYGPFASFDDAFAALRPLYSSYDDQRFRRRLEIYLKPDGQGSLIAKRDVAAREGARADQWEQFARVRCPVLMVWATEPHVREESVERMQRTLADLQVVRIECSHNVPAERPHELAEAIAAFATRTLAPA